MRIILPLLFAVFIPFATYSQTCCSGGVPLSNNLGLPASDKGTIQMALSYDLNVLETLKTGRRTLEDDSRSRRTHAFLWEIGYSFSEKFSIDGFFSFVRQEREINQFGNRNFSATNGIGDAVILFKYNVFATEGNNTLLVLGAGPKIPFGASDRRNELGLALNADLQPGSGAWDAVLFSQFTHVLGKIRPSMSFIATATYGIKGKNTEYFDVQTYQFGNELQFSTGLSDRLLIGKSIIDPSLTIRYRNQAPDEIDGETLPSTGGNWIFINPSFTYWFNANTSFNIGINLPVFADITGTQVTPTYRFTTGIFYRLSSKQEDIIDLKF